MAISSAQLRGFLKLDTSGTRAGLTLSFNLSNRLEESSYCFSNESNACFLDASETSSLNNFARYSCLASFKIIL